MKKFVVLTDSTCDLPEELAKQYDIDIMCFKIALDGEGYTERVDFSAEQFCEMLEKAKGLPMTSQITQFEFYDRFEEYERRCCISPSTPAAPVRTRRRTRRLNSMRRSILKAG